MPSQEDIDRQWQRLDAYRATLAGYLHQRALIGRAYEPPAVSNGINEARASIRHIKATLRNWDMFVEDLPDDEEHTPPPSHTFNYLHSENPPSDIYPRFPIEVYRREPDEPLIVPRDPSSPIYPTEHFTPLEVYRPEPVDPLIVPYDPSPSIYPIEYRAPQPPGSSPNVPESSSGGGGWFVVIIAVALFVLASVTLSSGSSSKGCTDAICFGQTKQGEISSAGEQAVYTFTAESGDKIIVIVSRALDDPRQGTLEPKITIEPKPPAELESSCAASDPLVARARCTLASTGTYTITIADRQGENTGMYRLFLQRVNNPGLATNLPFDKSTTGEATATGVLTTTAQRVTYTFATTDTARLDITVERTSGDLEPQIQIFQSDGNLLPDCDADDVEHIEVSCKPPLSGTYTILIFARNNGPTRGTYTLRIARFNPPHT